jgi:hypothetical protein
MQEANDTSFRRRVCFRVASQNMNATTGSIVPYREQSSTQTIRQQHTKFTNTSNAARRNASQRNASQRNASQNKNSLPNTSGRVFEHMNEASLLNNTTLDAAHALWVNSLRIPTESLDVCVPMPNASSARPLGVFLVLHCSEQPSVQALAYSLTMKISPSCSKTFAFTAGAQVGIPISTWRPTLVTVSLQQASNAIALNNVLVDQQTRTMTKIPGDNFLIQQNNCGQSVYSRVSTDTETINCQFPCYSYQRDADVRHEDYDMQSLSEDLTKLDERPVLLPTSKISFISASEALNQVAKLEHHRQQLIDTLHDCRRSTAIAELGATEETAAEAMKHIDWKRSYCVPSDVHLSQVIVLARDIHHMLASTSSLAVHGMWFFQPQQHIDPISQNVREAVSRLLDTRGKIAARIAGRRRDLQSVVRVRTSFLLLSAIDDALRSVCRTQTSRNTQSGPHTLFMADNIACHAYWLGQMKSNTNNSVSMDDECYSEARSVLDLCKRVKNSCAVLMPECSIKLSGLARRVWANMHLQGLASADALVVASAPHFLYKQRQVVDYSKHPFLLSLKTHQAPTLQQLESAKLLSILVSTDVEHRIITYATHQMIEQRWDLACQKSPGALLSLCSLFDAPLRSLITSAVEAESAPDISFITDANNRPPTTGYDNAVLSELNSEHLMSQMRALAL